jgi:hypothetical protein
MEETLGRKRQQQTKGEYEVSEQDLMFFPLDK